MAFQAGGGLGHFVVGALRHVLRRAARGLTLEGVVGGGLRVGVEVPRPQITTAAGAWIETMRLGVSLRGATTQATRRSATGASALAVKRNKSFGSSAVGTRSTSRPTPCSQARR
jgi:hypothetical protein